MDAVLNWLWQGSAVALALLVMLRPLSRARANVRYIVCWVGLLLVMAVPVVSWLAADAPSARVPVGAVVTVPAMWWTSGEAMAVAWAAWACVQTLLLARALVSLRRARTRSHPFPSAVEASLAHWQQVRHSGRRPAVVLSDSVTAAAVLGCGRPVIAVAPSLVSTLETGELDRVMIHEWAHVQRRDDLVQLLQAIVRIVAGWHPAVWWIERRLHVEREIACDEMTVLVTGSPKVYAACLVKVAGAKGVARELLAAPGVLTSGGLRARVTRIVSSPPFIAPVWSRGLAAGVVSVLGALAIGVGGLRLVETTVLALPFDSIPVALDEPAAIAPPPAPALAPSRSRVLASSRPAAESPSAPAPSASAEQVALPAELPSATDSAAAREGPPPPDETASEPIGPPAATVETEAGASQPPATAVTDAPERSPWTEVADRGTALGRTSKDAGVATAGFFSRLGRRVAGAF